MIDENLESPPILASVSSPCPKTCVMWHSMVKICNMLTIFVARYKSALDEWLDPIPVIADFSRIKSHRLAGSCTWVEKTQAYQDWLSKQTQNILWLTGSAGSGKSTITTHLIEKLEGKYATAYVFCDYMKPETQHWRRIVQTLIWQLLQQNSQKSNLVDEIFEVYAETAGISTPTSSFERALKILVEKGKQCLLVIDGLDESISLDKSALQRQLLDVSKFAKILLTGRQESWIVATLPPAGFHSLEILPTSTASDVESLISHRVSQKGWDDDTNQKVITYLKTGSKGMFLWAELMATHISQQTTPDEITKALSTTPSGLTEVYQRLIEQILRLPGALRELARRILQWTASSVRQLSLEELRVAVAVTPGSDGLKPSDLVVDFTTAILATCSPLVEIDEAKGAVRFVHATLMDFFRDAASKSSIITDAKILGFIGGQHNSYTASVCLTYLASTNTSFVKNNASQEIYDSNLKESLKQDVFIQYCTLNWWKHLSGVKMQDGRFDETLMLSFDQFLSSQKSIVRWIQLFMLLDAAQEGKVHPSIAFRPRDAIYSHLIMFTSDNARANFERLVISASGFFNPWDRWLMEASAIARNATPIGIAAFFDFLHVVKYELEQGNSLDMADPCGLTPLLYASHGEAVNTIKFLWESNSHQITSSSLTSEVVPNSPNGVHEKENGMTTLHAACLTTGWHPQVLEDLLKDSDAADLNAMDHLGRTPLHLAVSIDTTVAARLTMARVMTSYLLVKGSRTSTAISAQEAFAPISLESINKWMAAWSRPLISIKSLENDVPAVYQNLLSTTRHIKSNIVESLCSHNIKVDAVDKSGRTALHLVAKYSSEADSINNDGDVSPQPITPLDAAANYSERFGNDKGPVKLDLLTQRLLQLGFSASLCDLKGRTPLETALSRSNIPVAAAIDQSHNFPSDSSHLGNGCLDAIMHDKRLQAAGVLAPRPRALKQSTDILSKRNYHPESGTAISQTSILLLRLLSGNNPQGVIQNKAVSGIVSSILHMAQYWRMTISQINFKQTGLNGNTAVSELILGSGKVEKVDIFVARPTHVNGIRLLSREPSSPSSPESIIPRSLATNPGTQFQYRGSKEPPINENSELLLDSFNADGTLLELVRHPDQKTECDDIDPQGLSLDVSTEPRYWGKIARSDLGFRSGYDTWKQTWLLNEGQGTAETGASVGKNLKDWIEKSSAGDKLSLLSSEEPSIEDVMQFSGFALVIYSSLS
jgi:ankyrin repeat protein